MGCPAECEGAGCGDFYPAGDLDLWLGATLPEGVHSPLDGEGAVTGAAEDGPDRALLSADGGLWAGVPGASEVRAYDAASFLEGTGAVAALAGEEATDAFGAAMARMPDGVLVGAPGRTAEGGKSAAGAVYVFGGAALPGDVGEATAVVTGLSTRDQLGASLAACGDLDGDGVSDWAAGAPWAEAEEDAALLGGVVYVWRSAEGPPTGEVPASTLLAFSRAGDDGARYGAVVTCARSLDADGYAEFIVGAPFADVGDRPAAGVIEIRRGGPTFGPRARALVLSGSEAGDWFGAAVALAQLDDDGLPELVVGAPGHSADADVEDDTAGAVYVYDGARLQAALNLSSFEEAALEPDHTIRGVSGRGRLGASLLAADFDGDGIDELVVGAPGHNPTGEDRSVQAGGAWLFRGPRSAWDPIQLVSDAALAFVDERVYLRIGERMAAADVDGDGLPDLVLVTRSEGGGD